MKQFKKVMSSLNIFMLSDGIYMGVKLNPI
ncbi:hypothetical protein BCM19_000669 [Clostridium beijerinckii]|nr:hypothetical protein [Clostridium beijerinckii]NRZ23836.1 hypothetical protein [Clostridium beijerinckii]